MKPIIIFFFFVFPVFVQAQLPCIDGIAGILNAEAQGDSVVLYDNIVCRNCGASYSMEVTNLGNNQLMWIQHDTGQIAFCLCDFDLSVTIDSLQTGTYTTFVYYTYPYDGDTMYIGSISFTITDPIPYYSPSVRNQYQSPCGVVGLSPGNIPSVDSPLIYPNPAESTITVTSDEDGTLFIFDYNGLQLLQKEITQPTITIDVSILPSGVYVLKVVGEKKMKVGKFMKQ